MAETLQQRCLDSEIKLHVILKMLNNDLMVVNAVSLIEGHITNNHLVVHWEF